MLGKPKGTLQKSKFDQHLVRIKELLSYGLSVRKIARVLGYSSHIALNTYINKRGLHQVAKCKTLIGLKRLIEVVQEYPRRTGTTFWKS